MKPVLSRLSMALLASFAFIATGTAQAATQTLDFQGFTVSFDNSALSLSNSYQNNWQYNDWGYDQWWNYSNLNSGLQTNQATLNFADPSRSVEASGTNAVAQSTSFSFTVQAKSGWGIGYTNTAINGDWLQTKGGSVLIGSSTSASTTSGGTVSSYGNATTSTQSWGKTFQAGGFYASGTNNLSTYNYFSSYQYDAFGNYIGYKTGYTYDPTGATNLSTTTNLDLAAFAHGPGQYALAETNGQLQFNVTAYRQFADPNQLAAPVPEPESSAMLLAGLGLMGMIARRRKSRHA